MPVIAEYDAAIAAGALENDPAQRALARRLSELAKTVAWGGTGRGRGLLGQFLGARKVTPVRGLYIWGKVGRGKTLLMDMFHSAVPTQRKRRAHFHEFMADVHGRIHTWRQGPGKSAKDGDPIAPVAQAIAEEAQLLCFDEFHVTDIADAMVLGRLFTALFEHGVVLVATSNTAPDDLYHHGLNRQLFLPFIEVLKDHCDEVRLDSRTDFRLEKLAGAPVYYTPLGPASDEAMDAAFERLSGDAEALPETLTVTGRTVHVPHAHQGVARFSFSDLCEQPHGASDFLKIAHSYHTVFVDRIPVLEPEDRNAARRFVWLVDALYDNRVKMVASAAAEPPALYASGDFSSEFERTASRLIEMRGHEYLAAPHGAPLAAA
jgi:cell division protein ZapE